MSYCLPGTCGLDGSLALLVSDRQLPEDFLSAVAPIWQCLGEQDLDVIAAE
jgi:hypothetical protein